MLRNAWLIRAALSLSRAIAETKRPLAIDRAKDSHRGVPGELTILAR